MATVKEIERIILKVAGNPSSGAIKSLAPVWAEEIAKLDEPKIKRATVEPEETR
ncbi:hypothetical protein phiPsal1_007 [Pontimonas phage phiPsal1]|nr:hypothetical protein phiPsal1_007 [Pontimonas phage phiPsal1]